MYTASAMSTAATRPRLTYAEYLAAEEVGDVKHEYVNGEIFAMSGGTPTHGALAMAVGSLLFAALRDRPCRVFSSDVRIRVEASDFAAYPDVSVVCDQLEAASDDSNAVTNPVLIVEVLSDSTEAHDGGDKAACYRRIPSLREYLLVSQHRRRLELFRRNPQGRWELHEAGPGESLELASVEVRVDVDEVYRDPLSRE